MVPWAQQPWDPRYDLSRMRFASSKFGTRRYPSGQTYLPLYCEARAEAPLGTSRSHLAAAEFCENRSQFHAQLRSLRRELGHFLTARRGYLPLLGRDRLPRAYCLRIATSFSEACDESARISIAHRKRPMPRKIVPKQTDSRLEQSADDESSHACAKS